MTLRSKDVSATKMFGDLGKILQRLEHSQEVQFAVQLEDDMRSARTRALETLFSEKFDAIGPDSVKEFHHAVKVSLLKLSLCLPAFPNEDLSVIINDVCQSHSEMLELAANLCEKDASTTSEGGPFADGDFTGDIDPRNVIVDVVLSLSSRSSVVMRNIAERLFFGFQGLLTRTGLEDMLRVLTKSVHDKEEDEEEDDDSDGSDDDSDDDDSDNGDEDGGYDMAEHDADGRIDEGSDGEDDGDDDDDDAGANEFVNDEGAVDEDEEMFKADAHIASMLRANKEKKKGHAQKELQHFQLRVLVLLELYLKSTSSLAEYCIIPFIEAGKAAQVRPGSSATETPCRFFLFKADIAE